MPTVTNLGTVPNLWTSEYLSDLATEAEIKISTEVPCIFVRFPLNITAGTSVYDFSALSTPQYLTGIMRITYLGYTVHPAFPNEMRGLVQGFRPGNGDTQSSRPYIYLRSGYGINEIKFWPAPSATITYDSSDITLNSSIRNNVIVAGWRLADTALNYRIPAHIRQTLVRYYVMAYAYKKEGKGQNLEASKYFEFKYNGLLARFKKINSKLFTSRLNFTRDDAIYRSYGTKPPRPSLPPNFPYPRW